MERTEDSLEYPSSEAIFLNEYPLTGSGKIQKFKLRDSAAPSPKSHALPASQFLSEGFSLTKPLGLGKY